MRLEFFVLSLAILLCGCGENIPASGPKLELTALQKNEVLSQYQAIPVVNHDQMWVRGHAKEKQDCRLCHDGSAAVITRNDGKQSHWDVNLHHSEAMKCNTCHDELHPEQLIFGEKRVSFDQAYELCGSCHFQQKQDFLIGAHGKRLTGWAFPRIVKNCTECHQPHQPKFIAAPTVAHPTILPPRLQKSHQHE